MVADQFLPTCESLRILADRSGSMFAYLRIIVDSCRLRRYTPFSTRRMSLRNTNNSLAAGFLPLDSRLPTLTTGAIPEVPPSSANDVWEPIASD